MKITALYDSNKCHPLAVTMSRDPKDREFKRFMKKVRTMIEEETEIIIVHTEMQERKNVDINNEEA